MLKLKLSLFIVTCVVSTGLFAQNFNVSHPDSSPTSTIDSKITTIDPAEKKETNKTLKQESTQLKQLEKEGITPGPDAGSLPPPGSLINVNN